MTQPASTLLAAVWSTPVGLRSKQVSNYNADSNAGERRSVDFATLVSTDAAHSSPCEPAIRVPRPPMLAQEDALDILGRVGAVTAGLFVAAAIQYLLLERAASMLS
jgi:hypothetical protein